MCDPAKNDRTADSADDFLRRQRLWQELLDYFKQQRPDDAALAQVSTVAEIAIDMVFSAYRLTPEQQVERHGSVKDYAECSALYGFAYGLIFAARQQAVAGSGD